MPKQDLVHQTFKFYSTASQNIPISKERERERDYPKLTFLLLRLIKNTG